MLLIHSATEPSLIDPSAIESLISQENVQLYTVNDHFMSLQLGRYYCYAWVDHSVPVECEGTILGDQGLFFYTGEYLTLS